MNDFTVPLSEHKVLSGRLHALEPAERHSRRMARASFDTDRGNDDR